jgi:hypothetical protein
MPVSLRFRCQYCDERPDLLTHISLVAYLREHYGTIGFQVWRRGPTTREGRRVDGALRNF